jgi:hypothetical protein
VLVDPDQVVELRALGVADPAGGPPATWAGTFRGTELDALVTAALGLRAKGVYYTLNPLRAGRLVPQLPRVRRAAAGELATDADVPARRWVLVDVDPVRPPGHRDDSATDSEKEAALEVLGRVREYLTADGWPAPVVGDSGNGYHLLYRLAEDVPVAKVPVPADDPVRRLLRHLAARFDTPHAAIDTSVFNPARIVKLPGTRARKGPGTADRPHRRAALLEVPT